MGIYLPYSISLEGYISLPIRILEDLLFSSSMESLTQRTDGSCTVKTCLLLSTSLTKAMMSMSLIIEVINTQEIIRLFIQTAKSFGNSHLLTLQRTTKQTSSSSDNTLASKRLDILAILKELLRCLPDLPCSLTGLEKESLSLELLGLLRDSTTANQIS